MGNESEWKKCSVSKRRGKCSERKEGRGWEGELKRREEIMVEILEP